MKKIICLIRKHKVVCEMMYIVVHENVSLQHTHTCVRCDQVTKDEVSPVEEEIALLIRDAIADLTLDRQPVLTVDYGGPQGYIN